jgi:hypothetical protein
MPNNISCWMRLVAPSAIALGLCSFGWYRVRHMEFDLAAMNPIVWLVRFFTAFFLVSLFTPIVAVTAASLHGIRRKWAFLSGVLLTVGAANVLESLANSYGFFSGGMARLLSEIPYVLVLGLVMMPLLAWRNSLTKMSIVSSIPIDGNVSRVAQIGLIVLACCTVIPLANFAAYRLDMVRITLVGSEQERSAREARMLGTGSRAIFEYPPQISGRQEAYGMFAVGLASYVMIPLGFALSSSRWSASIFAMIALLLGTIASLLFVFYLDIPNRPFPNRKFTILRDDVLVYVIFFSVAGFFYYQIGFIAGKLLLARTTPERTQVIDRSNSGSQNTTS